MTKNNKRYVRFLLHREGPLVSNRQLTTAIRRTLLSLFGEVSVADSKFFLTEYDEETGIGVLQCSTLSLAQVMTSTALISLIGESRVSFQPKKTSGTIKGLR